MDYEEILAGQNGIEKDKVWSRKMVIWKQNWKRICVVVYF